MAFFLRPLPFEDALVILKGKNAGKATDELAEWAATITRQADASPVAPEPAIDLPAVTASTTDTFGASLVAGLYRISVYREVTVADPVSSSLAILLAWTHNGKALTRTLSAFAGAPQAVTDTISDVTIIEIDPDTTVSYTLTYASNTPGLAAFHATLLAELLQTLE